MRVKPRLKEEVKKFLRQKQEEEENKVIITTPYRLNEQDLKQVLDSFPDLKEKRAEQIIDDSLIAGIVIKHGSKITDLSLKQYLTNLEQRINEIS